jgi:dienelactone hydrolase
MAGVTDFEGFTRRTETFDGVSHEVYRGGSGPAVLVIHEIPGLHPAVVHFARRVVDAGFTAVMPSLFGTPGRPLSGGYVAGTVLRMCVAREFTMLASGRSALVVGWLRALAARVHEECGGPGVGAVGMCMTGGYALAMAVDDRMLAPVLSQPAQPAPFSAARRQSIDITPADLATVKTRAADGLCVLGLRFTNDRGVPAERFAMLRRELGDAFIAVEIDSSPGNPHGIKPSAHSVLAADLVDEEGHPTHDALERVLAFFRERLAQPG